MCVYVCIYVCVFVRDNLENGWMDFHNFFLFEPYGPWSGHGLHELLKAGLETVEKWGKLHKNAYKLPFFVIT